MGKKNKAKKNKNKGKQNKQGDANNDTGDFNLTLDYTEELKNSGSSQERNQQVPDIEPNFDSTEKKAREDMEQCEKLLGVKDEVETPIEEIQKHVEQERIRVKQILKDKEYEEIKKLTRKQKKNRKDVESIYYDKRLNSKDKIVKLYDIVYKVISENQKLKEKQFDEQLKIERVRKDFEIKLLGIQKQRKQKQMLYNLFQGLKEKNIEAYKLKDEAIKQQQDAKKEMTKMFETEIEKITSSYQDQLSIKSQYEAKKSELEVLAEEYKVLETQTKALIDQKDKKIHNLQEDINNKIEKELKGLMDSFNNEKTRYDKLTTERENLNGQYKDLKEKFTKYMSEIEGSDSKIKTYNKEIENLQNKVKNVMEENLMALKRRDTLRQLLK